MLVRARRRRSNFRLMPGAMMRMTRVNLFIILLSVALAMVVMLASFCCSSQQHTKHRNFHSSNHYNHHHHNHNLNREHDSNKHKQHRPARHNEAHRKHAHHTNSGGRLLKRQAVELAVNRLRILESLDGQLRQFAEPAEATIGYDLRDAQQAGSGGGGNYSAPQRGSGSPERPSKQPASKQQQHQQLCSLNLKFGPKWRQRRQSDDRQFGGCLANRKLKRHIPPYMLNLHRQLISECQTLADAVQLMPYKSLIMRSFRQPALIAPAAGKQVDDRQHESGSSLELGPPPPSLVVELSAIKPLLRGDGDDDDDVDVDEPSGAKGVEQDHVNGYGYGYGYEEEPENGGHHNSIGLGRRRLHYQGDHELDSYLDLDVDRDRNRKQRPPSMDGRHQEEEQEEAAAVDYGNVAHLDKWARTGGACHLNQRSLVAHERSELCYWFQISERLQMRINGSAAISGSGSGPMVPTANSSDPNGRADVEATLSGHERLVEAELHLFKLFPELLQANESPSFRTRRNGSEGPTVAANKQAQQQRQTTTSDRLAASAASSYHLKTNLLEVSLYQILPKKTSNRPVGPASDLSGGGGGSHQKRQARLLAPESEAEFPLRLLDIRRIDLHSSGWETFYVKRAVEDWIQDASTNLGLVIKAKSMFEEPIRIGLIRFADMYDQRAADKRRRRPRGHQRPSIGESDTSGSGGGGGGGSSLGGAQAAGMNANGNAIEAKNKNGNESSSELERVLEFNLDHQPILVIYTTIAAATVPNQTNPTNTNQ